MTLDIELGKFKHTTICDKSFYQRLLIKGSNKERRKWRPIGGRMLLSKQIFLFYGHINEHENMQPVPKDMAKAFEVECGLCDDENELTDFELPIAYNELRHREKIEGSKKVTQSWRMKERVCF